ncbi:MAG: AAA family ATPase [Clostridium sp.]|nr:AAA family ATPase [Clostridium sp.]
MPTPEENAGIPRRPDPRQLAELILTNLPYVPTDQQLNVMAALARFCTSSSPDEAVFVLNGYAGTGKTSLTGALVKALASLKIKTVLLAPTGRAAKVFGAFAGQPASTIHRRIYRHSLDGVWTGAGMLAENNSANTFFIVDEASMIGNDGGADGRASLLDDLVQYVFSGTNCRMILLGDTAQLPPVGCDVSPAMDPATLRSLGLRVSRAVMTATVRQARQSGILYNATWLRHAMRQGEPYPEPQLTLRGFDDVHAVDGEEMLDALTDCYGRDGYGETLIITRSNRRAVQFNQAVRSTILERTELLQPGERLMVAKNNYIWSRGVKGLDFIANGDMAVVNRIYGFEDKYGFRFADVSLNLPDRSVDFDCKLILDALVSESPALTHEEFATLWERILSDPDMFSPTTPMDVRARILRTDPCFNALQVKYAYAVTCHKSQGGQWRNVFVDMGYIPPEAQGLEFYRWLYTSTTRATERLYYVNPAVRLID